MMDPFIVLFVKLEVRSCSDWVVYISALGTTRTENR